jgi:hypothetical protein
VTAPLGRRALDPYGTRDIGTRPGAISRRSGVAELSWLRFRQTYSSWAHEKGVPGKIVATLIGHAKVDTTLKGSEGHNTRMGCLPGRLGPLKHSIGLQHASIFGIQKRRT